MALHCLPLLITALVRVGAGLTHRLPAMVAVERMPGMIALMGTHAGKSAFRILMALVMHSLYGIGSICSVSLGGPE